MPGRAAERARADDQRPGGRLPVPEPHGPATGRGHEAPGRVHGQPVQVRAAAGQHRLFLLDDVPQADRVVPPAVGQGPAVGAERDLHLRPPGLVARRTEGVEALHCPEVGDVDLPVVEPR